MPPTSDNKSERASSLWPAALSFLLGVRASISSIAIQHSKCGHLLARSQIAINSFSVSPTKDRLSSVLDSGSIIDWKPPFFISIFDNRVLPVPLIKYCNLF